MGSADALGRHRIFLKPTILFVPVALSEHSQCARMHGDDCAKLYFDRNEGTP